MGAFVLRVLGTNIYCMLAVLIGDTDTESALFANTSQLYACPYTGHQMSVGLTMPFFHRKGSHSIKNKQYTNKLAPLRSQGKANIWSSALALPFMSHINI